MALRDEVGDEVVLRLRPRLGAVVRSVGDFVGRGVGVGRMVERGRGIGVGVVGVGVGEKETPHPVMMSARKIRKPRQTPRFIHRLL